MEIKYTWGADLVSEDNLGLEALNDSFVHPCHRNPINIVVENGVIYVTAYVCGAMNHTPENQKFLIWLDSLKQTDYVKLSVSSVYMNIPIKNHLSLLAAIKRCKATIEIQLDTIVSDTLAYFYLVANKIKLGSSGALLIPSYLDSDKESKSGPWKAVHDFIQILVDDAELKGILTVDDATRLHDGKSVVIPNDRF